MRVLHTADWHLGQHFLTGQERLAEQRAFLDWLLAAVREYGVEALVLAGDVFDVTSPSHAAQELYYDFLVRLQGTGCRDVVVVAGNHDSPTLLNAGRRLLRALRVHVTGSLPADPAEQLVLLNDDRGRPGLLVAAVPFLRDRDLRPPAPGESPDERQARIQASVAGHYQLLSEHDQLRHYRAAGVPVLATGHLYAAGGEAREGAERDVHLGGLGVVGAEHFPVAFDYVALGHLHRPQVVGGQARIRYAGSPVPLSFTEADDKQQVLLLDFVEAGREPLITPLPVPVTRRLQRFHGSLPEVEQALAEFNNEPFRFLACADVLVLSDDAPAEVKRRIEAALKDRRHALLAPRGVRHQRLTPLADATAPAAPLEHLHDLTPNEVFRRRVAGLPPAQAAALTATFEELQRLLAQADPGAAGGANDA